MYIHLRHIVLFFFSFLIIQMLFCIFLHLDHFVVNFTFGLCLHAYFFFFKRRGFRQCSSFDFVSWSSNELRAGLFSFGDSVALLNQVIVDLVTDHTVLLVLWMFSNKFPHPLGHGHQFTCCKCAETSSQADSCMNTIFYKLEFVIVDVLRCMFT